MTYRVVRSEEYMEHHGILGMHWGRKNGPPYPLGSGDHSASEKKAGWRKSLGKGSVTSNKQKKSGLTDKQKRAIKIGATVAATALAAGGAYYLYKTGKLDKIAELGKNKVSQILQSKIGVQKVGDVNSKTIDAGKKTAKSVLGAKADIKDITSKSVIRDPATGLKKLVNKESFADSLKNANPKSNDISHKNNCTLASIVGFLRTQGYDVTAGSTGGKQQILSGVLEDCFKGVKVLDGSAIKFGRSVEDASEMLVKRFGNNASGVVSIQWKKGSPASGGHAFNWFINDGKVSFADFQSGRDNDIVKQYWKWIDPNNSLTLARLDNLEINKNILKYVE